MNFKIEKNNGENLFTVSDENTITIFKLSGSDIYDIIKKLTEFTNDNSKVPIMVFNRRSGRWEKQ